MLNFIKNKTKYIYNNIIYPRILTRRYKDILNKNLEIEGLHQGQRCFIFGTGPSMKDLDLDKFKAEPVFVVNDFDRHPQFKSLQRVHQVIPDAWYFMEDKKTYFWDRLKHKSDHADPKTVYFFHIKGKDLITREGLFNKNKIYYLNSQGIISEHFDFNIDLDKTLPWPKNSLLSCLMIAVYMGFKEIYLLGFEHSYLATHTGLEQGKSRSVNHFYVNTELEETSKMKESEAEEILRRRFKWDREINNTYEEKMIIFLQLFKNYRLFYQKVRKLYPEIKIFNATPNSFLDVFPAMSYEDLLKKL